jgi:hypothetical protein
MITPKQRAYLKRQAHTLTPSLVIGKGGLSEELIKQLDEQLEKRDIDQEYKDKEHSTCCNQRIPVQSGCITHLHNNVHRHGPYAA